MRSDGLERAIEQSHVALREFVNGNPEPFQSLYSNQDDVTLGNPFGPFVHGRQSVVSTAAAAATRYRDGQVDSVDAIAVHASSDLACVVEVERFRAKVGGSKDSAPVSLRVTSVYRTEDGVWKLVHRHADPITTPQATESVIQR